MMNARLRDDRRLVRAEAPAQAKHFAYAARERREDFRGVRFAAVVAEAFEVDAQRRARSARARQAQDDARAVFEEDAYALPPGRAAVDGVCVGEVVGARDAAPAERRAR